MIRSGLLLAAGSLALLGTALAWAEPSPSKAAAGDDQPRQETAAGPKSPLMSAITSPTPTCHRVEPGTGDCLVSWTYVYVDASPDYLTRMTIAIDGHLRARIAGFFQSSMYVPMALYAPGFTVRCGLLGSGGDPELGGAHPWVIQAFDTSGPRASNYGAVFCPADEPVSGRVPDGSSGVPLTIAKAESGQLTLTWGASCLDRDTDYSVYEGTVGGTFDDHTPDTCTTGGATSATVLPKPGSRFFLIAPHNDAREGSLGQTGAGAERPPGPAACMPRALAVCE